MTELTRTVDPHWYNQPGFPELEGAWCQVFESREQEGYALNPVEALKLVDSVRGKQACPEYARMLGDIPRGRRIGHHDTRRQERSDTGRQHASEDRIHCAGNGSRD